jgi:hypothetical protein
MSANRFKDSAGREWALTVDVVEMRRVREACQVHLGRFKEVHELGNDIEKFADVLWVMVEEQAKSVKTGAVTREQFLRSLVGDVLPAANDALMEAYLFFCPTTIEAEIRALMATPSEASPSMTSNGTPGSSAEPADSTPIVPA